MTRRLPSSQTLLHHSKTKSLPTNCLSLSISLSFSQRLLSINQEESSEETRTFNSEPTGPTHPLVDNLLCVNTPPSHPHPHYPPPRAPSPLPYIISPPFLSSSPILPLYLLLIFHLNYLQLLHQSPPPYPLLSPPSLLYLIPPSNPTFSPPPLHLSLLSLSSSFSSTPHLSYSLRLNLIF